MKMKEEIMEMAKRAKGDAGKLAHLSARVKNDALFSMARALIKNEAKILKENKKDLALAGTKGFSSAFKERLTLNELRIKAMSESLKEIALLEDPVGEVIAGWSRPNGLQIRKIRVPLGVIGIIYESRPNVTADAIGLCIKSGNSVLLRGGSEAICSNIIIARILQEAAREKGIPAGCINLVKTTDRAALKVMLRCSQYIDVLIPRGGRELIKRVKGKSSVPVIETGAGNCHLYVDKDAHLGMALDVCLNAKVQRPGVCNAIETLLVHKKIAPVFLPLIRKKLEENKVELRGCAKSRMILRGIRQAKERDWYEEYLDLILAVKVVDNLRQAISHINKYGSRHSESIITESYTRANKFLQEVDAACVYVNASTRFTDGGEFGFGAELGISTQMLHARGPLGLKELTSTKYIILGQGQTRK